MINAVRDHETEHSRYLVGDTSLFKQKISVAAKYNRLVLYPSNLLHCANLESPANYLNDIQGGRLTLEVDTEDPSVRAPSDPRFTKPLDSRVIWYKHQGPGEVDFTEHSTMPFISSPTRSIQGLMLVAPARVAISADKSPARVIATFSEPGEHLIRARLDIWKASDSDGLDQCCWSNAFQRVHVTP